MNKNKIILIGIISVFAAISLSYGIKNFTAQNNYSQTEFEQNIKEITSNTKVIDANLDHNQALDVIEYAVRNNIKIPEIIINFDTHSDITLNENSMEKTARIDNWLNEYLAKYPEVKELYWVMPREEDSNLALRIYFGENKEKYLPDIATFYGNVIKKDMKFHFLFNPLDKTPYSQIILANTKTGNLEEYNPNKTFDPNEYKKIKITTCTEKTLPDFKNREVFLSIDADYISNSGYDTLENFTNNKNQKQIDSSLYSMVETIKNKNIRPSIINLTLSPQYLPKEDHQQIISFFEKIFEISGQKDALQIYLRKYNN